jgi:hypothetical protein
MSAPENLYALIQRLGMTAIKQTALGMRIVEQRKSGGSSDIALEQETRDQVDQLIRASISFTAKLLVVSSPDPSSARALDTARDLEAHLTASLDRTRSDRESALGSTLHKAIQKLTTTAATFALIMTDLAAHGVTTAADPFKIGTGATAREQTYALARAAITFTTQLLVVYSSDPESAREPAAEMEDELVEFLDNAPWYEGNHDDAP